MKLPYCLSKNTRNLNTRKKMHFSFPNTLSLLALLTFVNPLQDFAQSQSFTADFAPQEGLVKRVEQPQREEICLNGLWQFKAVKLKNDISLANLETPPFPQASDFEQTPIKIPSPWNVNSFTNGTGGDFRSFPSYPESWDKVQSAWMKKDIMVPENWSGNRLVLHFEAVAGLARVFVNGKMAGEHFDLFLPFDLDITDKVKAGEQAEILVWVTHGNVFNDRGKYGYRNHVSGSFWGTHIAGIWQDVFLHKIPEINIEDTYIQPLVSENLLRIEVTLSNKTQSSRQITLKPDVYDWINQNGNTVLESPETNWKLGEKVLQFPEKTVSIEAGATQTFRLETTINGKLKLWSPESPALYGAVISLSDEGKYIDKKYTRFGWREFSIEGKKFLLNGEPIVIKSDSWHFTGVPQMTRRYAWSWYRMLKDANANGVRLHAQVFPRFYLEMADEMGICVLDETAIWSSDGGPKIDSEIYWEAARNHVKNLVLRDRNYPSVFGWSVCNETLPVTKNVFKAPKELLIKNAEEINKWIAIAQQYDHTRDWISGDGETPELLMGVPVKTNFTTVIGHYGPKAAYKYWAKHGKPWGIGETGMGYYGTPAQIAKKFNGDRAFESQQGRMEGLAWEAFELIKAQRKNKAAYTSVFNLAWYGLKPLELGLSDISRPYNLRDGIFFNEFKEGKPGYQPERLGPYSSTFNPGYDPSLPLYDPWPLFEAVKLANSDNYLRTTNKWKDKTDNTVKIKRLPSKKGVVWLSSNQNNPVKAQFENIGLRFDPLNTKMKQLIIIDGKFPPEPNNNIIPSLQEAMQVGSIILFWNTDQSANDFIEKLSGASIDFLPRVANSYIIKGKHAILRKENNTSLYFSEATKTPVSSLAIAGKWIKDADVILEASNTDWQKWNYQGEDIKTAKVLRNEREKKNSGTVIARKKYGKGEIIISTLDLFSLNKEGKIKTKKLIRNLGSPFKGKEKDISDALNKTFMLSQALLSGPSSDFHSEDSLLSNDLLKKSGKSVIADENGRISLPGNSENETSIVSFWIYSPRSLTDLLIEPDMPQLDMYYSSSTPLSIAINTKHSVELGKSLSENVWKAVPLEKGWNFVSIRINSLDNSSLQIRFSSNQKEFLNGLKSAAEL